MLLGNIAWAQEMQLLSQRHLSGTARYVGMAGAMTAVGGDPTAAMDNPAGLGIYRRSEVSITIDLAADATTYASQDAANSLRCAMPNLSAIWAVGNANKQKGLIYSNFMFTINRLANLNREVHIKGASMDMLPVMCYKTNGLLESELQDKPWDNYDIGWLSILGYEGYLINPSEGKEWVPALNMTEGEMYVSETGNADQYSISWAANISNQWYVGLGLNIPTWNYTKMTSLYETDRINSAEFKSLYRLSGVGVTASAGLIYRPVKFLRLGLSAHTPTVMSLTEQTEGDVYTKVDGHSYEVLTPASGEMELTTRTPWRTSASVAAQIGKYAMLAFQYDYAQAVSDKETQEVLINNQHAFRVGAEVQLCRSWFLNMGYSYETPLMDEDPVVELAYNAIRTDMDYRYIQQSQSATLSLGYRSDVLVAQLAYQYRWQTWHQYATEAQIQPFVLDANTHHFVFTLGWRI